MKATFEGKQLMEACELVSGITVNTKIIDAAQKARFELLGGRAELTTTNLDTVVKCVLDSKSSDGDGVFVLPISQLASVSRSWHNDDTIALSHKNNKLVVSSKSGRFTFNGEDAGRFPHIQNTECDDFIETNSIELYQTSGAALHAVLREAKLSILNSVLIVVEGDCVIFYATDERRMAVAKSKIVNSKNIQARSALSQDQLKYIRRFLAMKNETVRVAFGESNICFWSDTWYVQCQAVSGRYPKCEEFLKINEFDKKIEVNTEKFLSLTRSISYIFGANTQCAKFTFKDKALLITARTESGDIELNYEFDTDIPEFVITLNPAYIADALMEMDSETVTMEFKDKAYPVRITNGRNRIELIMPMEIG